VLWLVPLALALFGLALLVACAWRVSRELGPTQDAITRFGRDLRPIMLRVRDDNARIRRRLDD